MTLDPVFPIPLIATVAGVAVLLTIFRAATGRAMRPSWLQFPALVFRVAAVALLALFLLNPSTPVNVTVPDSRAVILVDESASMSLGTRWQDASAWATEVEAGLKKDGLPSPGVFVFSSSVDPVTDSATLAARTPSGAETNLSRALERVLSSTGALPPDHIVVISDGRAHDRAALPAALAAARVKGVGISTHAVGTDTPPRNTWIAAVQSPRSVRSMSKVAVHVDVDSTGVAAGEVLSLVMKDESGAAVARTDLRATGDGKPVESVLTIESGLRSARYSLELAAPGKEVTMDDNRFDFSVDVANSKLRVLFVEGTHVKRTVGTNGYWWNDMELMTRAWDATGEIEYQCLTPVSEFLNSPNIVGVTFVNGEMLADKTKDFPKTREELYRYDVMLISDVPVGNFSTEQMQWVVDWVTERGGGFLMGGGYTTFDAGHYDQTPWEKITPVDMLLAGDGFNEMRFKIEVPKSVRNHPTWRMDPDPAKSDEIINTHPDFTGMNRVRRAKPGAIVLMTRPDKDNEPVIAAQQYGRGRSIAYLGDPNGGWAKYLVSWGPPGGPPHGPHTELGHGERFKFKAEAAKSASGPPPPHPSPYYAKYWTNVVKWLGENSIRWHRDKLAGRIAAAQAEPGKDLPVAAEVLAVASRDALLALDVGARLDKPGSPRVRLEYDRDRREFVGAVPIPADFAGTETAIIFDTVANEEPFTDSVRVGLRRENREFTDYKPDRAFLAELAQAGGGVAVESAADAVRACRDAATKRAQEAGKTWNRPDWPKWPWWTALVAVLCAEWAVRRFGSRALAAALCIFCVPGMAQETPKTTPEEIAALIEQLGAPRVRLRDEAEEKLKAIPEALEAAKSAAKGSLNEELRLRARNVAQALRQNLWQEEIVVEGHRLSPTAYARAIAVSPDGTRFYTRGEDHMRAWDAATMKPGITFGPALSMLTDWQRTGPVTTIAISPDGKRVVTTNEMGVMVIHNAEDGAPLATLTNPSESRTVTMTVNGVPQQVVTSGSFTTRTFWGASFFPDGKKIVTCDRGGWVRTWDSESGELLKSMQAMLGQVCGAVAVSPDAKFIAAAIDYGGEPDYVWIWSIEREEWVHKETVSTRLNTLRFTRDGKRLLGSHNAGMVLRWDVAETGVLSAAKQIGSIGKRAAWAVFAPDEKSVFAVGDSQDGQIAQFDVETGEELWRSPRLEKLVESIDFLTPDRFVTVGNDNLVRLWQLRGSGRKPLEKKEKPAEPSARWRLAKQGESDVRNPTKALRSMVASPDGKTLFTRNQEHVQAWSAETLERGITFGAKTELWKDWYSSAPILTLAISPDGKQIVATNDTGTISIHNAATGTVEHTIETSRTEEGIDARHRVIWQAAFLPNGTQLVTGDGGGNLKVWNIANGELIFSAKGTAEYVRAMAVSPDGKRIAMASANGVLAVCDLEKRTIQQTLNGYPPEGMLRFNKAGTTLITAGHDGVIKVFSMLPDGNIGTARDIKSPSKNTYNAVAFSEDEMSVFAAATSGEIIEFDFATGKELWRSENLGAEQDAVVVLGPNRVASYGRNDRMRVWRIAVIAPSLAEEKPKVKKQSDWQLEKQGAGGVDNARDIPRRMIASADGKILLTRNQEFLQIWNTETLERGITFGAKSELWTDFRRNGPCTTIAVSPDGKRVVTTDDIGNVSIHDTETGKVSLTLENKPSGDVETTAEQRTLWQAEFFADGNQLATTDRAGNLRVWDAATGKMIWTLSGGTGTQGRTMAVAPDGSTIVVAFDGNGPRCMLCVCDVRSRTWTKRSSLSTGLNRLVFTRDSSQLVGAAYGGVHVWSIGRAHLGILGNERVLKTPGYFNCESIAISADERAVYAGLGNGSIVHLDFATGKELWRTESLGAPQDAIVVLGADRFASYGRNDRLRVWQRPATPASGEPAVESPKPEKQAGWQLEKQASGNVDNLLDFPRNMIASPDKTKLYTRNQDFLQVWNADTLERGITFGAKSEKWKDWHRGGPVLTLAISPDGKHIVTTDDDGTITISSADSGQTELEFENLPTSPIDKRIVWQAAYFPDGMRLATTDFTAHLRVWDTATGKELMGAQGPDWALGRALAVSPNGKNIAVCFKATNFGSIWIFDSETGAVLQRTDLPAGQHRLAYNRDGSVLISAGYDGVLSIWAVEGTGKIAKSKSIGAPGALQDLYFAAFSDDEGSIITGGAKGELVQYDVATAKELWRSESLGAAVEAIVVLGPDCFASYGRNDRLRIWKRGTTVVAPEAKGPQ